MGFARALVLCQGLAVVGAAGMPQGEPRAERSSPLVRLFPREGATGVCPDTPLRITFPAPPDLGSSGKIQVFDASGGTAVETIDIAAPHAVQAIGGLSGFKYHPVTISGAEVTIHLRDGALSYNKTYQVSIAPTVFKDGAGRALVGALGRAWRFTTKATAPPASTQKLTVAADGTGDFSTVQGAFDFIPGGNTTPRTVFVRRGSYEEIVFFADKHAITVLGEDREQTVITYTNNDQFNHAAGNPYAVAGANPSDAVISHGDAIYHRAVFMAHRANDLVIANLTIRNTTPSGGTQAEALILNGTGNARAILKDVNLIGTKDTLQINGQAYVTDCTIEGDVDFMWGQGPAFFEGCTCRSIRSNGFYTQIRNHSTNHGFVYVRCQFVGMPGVVDNYLTRIKTQRFPDSEVVLIDSVLGTSLIPVLWQIEDASAEADAGAAHVHFWEFNSRDGAGAPAAIGARLPISRQLRTPEDAGLIAQYGDPTFVLGNRWNPRTAPIIADHATHAGPRLEGARPAPAPVGR